MTNQNDTPQVDKIPANGGAPPKMSFGKKLYYGCWGVLATIVLGSAGYGGHRLSKFIQSYNQLEEDLEESQAKSDRYNEEKAKMYEAAKAAFGAEKASLMSSAAEQLKKNPTLDVQALVKRYKDDITESAERYHTSEDDFKVWADVEKMEERMTALKVRVLEPQARKARTDARNGFNVYVNAEAERIVGMYATDAFGSNTEMLNAFIQAYRNIVQKAQELKDFGVSAPAMKEFENKVNVLYTSALKLKEPKRMEPGEAFEEFLRVELSGDQSFVDRTRNMTFGFMAQYEDDVGRFLQGEIEDLMNLTDRERNNSLQELQQTLDDAECIRIDTLR